MISVLLAVAMLSGCGVSGSGPASVGSGAGQQGGASSQTSESQKSEESASGTASFGNSAASEEADLSDEASRQFFAMDTVMDLAAYGEGAEAAVAAAQDLIMDMDARFSAESEASEVAELNRNGGGPCDMDLIEMVERAEDIREHTGGAFNICLYPVKKAWGFADGNYRVPDEEELSMLLPLADPGQLSVLELPAHEWGIPVDDGEVDSSGALYIGLQYGIEGMEMDLGGIAKGMAAVRTADLLERSGMTGAMINLGGNVVVMGAKPDGSPWRVGIMDPDGTHDYLGILELPADANAADGLDRISVVTSGGYERFFEQDGVRYHHILDPATGWPADSGLVSATIVSEDATLADALSTAIFILGREKAEALWQSGEYDFEMILLEEDGEVFITPGLVEAFSSEYPVVAMDL